jgi:hypothetical protein
MWSEQIPKEKAMIWKKLLFFTFFIFYWVKM